MRQRNSAKFANSQAMSMTWTRDTGHGTAETAYTANGAGHSELGHEQAASRNRLDSSLSLCSPSPAAWLKVKTEKGLHFLPKCNGYGERSRRKQKGRREKRDRQGRGNGVRQATTVQLPHTHPQRGPDVPQRIVKLCGSFDNFVSTRSSSPPTASLPLYPSSSCAPSPLSFAVSSYSAPAPAPL